MRANSKAKFLALQAERAKFYQEADGLLAGDAPSPEGVARAMDLLKVQIPALDEQLGAFQALLNLERGVVPVSRTPLVDLGAGDPNRGFSSMADFAHSVRSACAPGGSIDPRLRALYRPGSDTTGQPLPMGAPTGYMHEGGSVGEGYEVPPAMRAEIWSLVFDESDDLVSFVNPEPTSSNSIDYVKDETTPWGAAGVQAYWRAEAGQMTPSKQATKGGTIKLNELYAFVLASEELLSDAPRLNSRLTKGAAAAIRWKSSEAVMFGDGVGKPLGWMHGPCLVTVAKESSQSAAGIVGLNVVNMFSRNLGPGRASWLAHSDTIPQLATMTLGNYPIWTPPSSGFVNAPGGFLLGRPIKLTDHCQTMGTLGDIQFVDPTGYLAAIKTGGVKFDSSIHLYFDYNVEAFRWIFRLGGHPVLSAAVSPAKGSNTRSHFVALATRP